MIHTESKNGMSENKDIKENEMIDEQLEVCGDQYK